MNVRKRQVVVDLPRGQFPDEIVQKPRLGLRTHIGHQSLQAAGSDLDACAIRFCENGIADERIEKPNSGVAI
jgi:hypothetical protein